MATAVYSGTAYGTTICVDSSGTSWILYRTYESSAYNLRLYSVTSTGIATLESGPLNAATVHGDGTHVGKLDMCIDSSDVLHVVALAQPAGVTRDLVYNSYDTTGSGWGSWTEISSHKTAHTSNWPYIKCDSSDNLWVFFGYNPKDFSVIYYINNIGGSWNTEVGIGGSGKDAQYFTAGMCIDDNDYVHFYYMYYDYTGPTYKLGWRQYTTSLQSAYEETMPNSYYSGTGHISVIWDGTYSKMFKINSVVDQLATKQQSSSTTTDTGTDTELIPPVSYIGSDLWACFTPVSSNYNELHKNSGSGWSKDQNINDGTYNASNNAIAYQNHNANYSYPHVGWQENSVNYFQIFSGQPATPSSVHAYATMGGQPTDSKHAYLSGRERFSYQPAFIEGFTDGVSVKHAYMPVRPPSIPAYMYGVNPVYFDVVNFTAKTSTGTQDVTGDLNGNEPIAAIFMGSGTATNSTQTDDMRMFLGVTDGTNSGRTFLWCENGGTTSSPTSGGTDTGLAGGTYTGQGNAYLDSFITDGVRLNYTTPLAASAWDWSALLISADNPDQVQAYKGNISWSPENGDTSEQDIGFQPDIIIFFAEMWETYGGCCFQWGIALPSPDVFEESTLHKDIALGEPFNSHLNCHWGTQYFNWPTMHNAPWPAGVENSPGTKSSYAVRNAHFPERISDQVISWTPTGFVFEATYGDGSSQDVHYLALKFGYPYKVYHEPGDTIAGSQSGTEKRSTGNQYLAPFRPLAVIGGWHEDGWDSDSGLYGEYSGSGYFMTDGTDEWAASCATGLGGSAWSASSYGSDARTFCFMGGGDNGWPIRAEASISSFDSDGWTVSYVGTTSSAGNALSWIAFGIAMEDTSRQHAYLWGQSPIRSAYTRGGADGSSSTGAFFNVVDAMDSKHCYIAALDPSRSSKGAYCLGKDVVVVAIADFQIQTSSGNQTITTSEMCGVTPDAMLIFLGGATSQGVWQNGSYHYSFGISDGTSHFCVAGAGSNELYWDENCDYNTEGGYSRDHVLGVCSPTSTTPSAIASFSSFVTNGVTITWNNAPPAGYYGTVVFFGGSSLELSMDKITEPYFGSSGYSCGGTANCIDHNVSGLGFEPDMLICISNNRYQDLDTAGWVSSGHVYPSISFAVNDNTPDQYADISYSDQSGSMMCAHYDAPNGYAVGGLECSVCYPDTIGTNYQCLFSWFAWNAWVKSYNSDGYVFTTWCRSGQSPEPQNDWYILALGFASGGRRAMLARGDIDIVEGEQTLTKNPDYNNEYHIITPEAAILSTGFNQFHYGYGNDPFFSTLGPTSSQLAFMTQSMQTTLTWSNYYIWWYCHDQFYDQVCGAKSTSGKIAQWYSRQDPGREGSDDFFLCLSASADFVVDGIKFDIDYIGDLQYEPSTGGSVHWWYWLMGVVEWADSQSAYMKGQKDDWPSRTPRGCYLEGTIAEIPVEDSIPAFMQVGPGSNISAFIEGYLPTSSTKAAYLHGVDTDLDGQFAFVLGSMDVSDNQYAYSHGESDTSGANESFLRGSVNVSSSNENYLAGGIIITSSVSAYLKNGWETLDNRGAYLSGIESRDNIPVYILGFSANPTSSTSAFTNGAGPWPFTDDYTGSDEDPWNSAKWISTEEL